jgi:UDP-glucuronate 4-epimerase
MSILIMGGLGHVGSWVAYEFAKMGRKVIIADAAASQFDQLELDYLEEVRDNLVLENVDVLDFHTMVEVVSKYADNLEGMIHGVAVIAGPTFQQRPFKNISINTVGVLNVLEACRILGIRKFINLSSGAVYGDAPGGQTEETPFKATDLYSATKIANEVFTLQYGATYGLDVRNARLYFVYGPGKLPSRMHLLYQAMFGALEGLSGVASPNGGDQQLDWTHVRDSAQGIVKLFEAKGIQGRSFNISSGNAISHRKIVELVQTHVGRDTGMTLGPGYFVKRGAPLDITRARQELGYEPQFVDIREGIANYGAWLAKRAKP